MLAVDANASCGALPPTLIYPSHSPGAAGRHPPAPGTGNAIPTIWCGGTAAAPAADHLPLVPIRIRAPAPGLAPALPLPRTAPAAGAVQQPAAQGVCKRVVTERFPAVHDSPLPPSSCHSILTVSFTSRHVQTNARMATQAEAGGGGAKEQGRSMGAGGKSRSPGVEPAELVRGLRPAAWSAHRARTSRLMRKPLFGASRRLPSRSVAGAAVVVIAVAAPAGAAHQLLSRRKQAAAAQHRSGRQHNAEPQPGGAETETRAGRAAHLS